MADYSPVIVIKKRTTGAEEKKKLTFQPVNEGLKGSILDYYNQAWVSFNNLSFPSGKEEAWRRTDIRGLELSSITAQQPGKKLVVPDKLKVPLTDTQHGGQIILTGNESDRFLADDLQRQGVIFLDLQSAFENYPQLVEQILGKLIKPEEEKFGALAAAMAKAGVLLYIPKNVKVKAPVHSLIWNSGKQEAFFSHILVYLDEGSQVTYVHESASPDGIGGQSLHSGLMEIFVGKEANLTFVELQSWGDNVWNFTHERINVEKDGNVDWIFGALGSRLTKNFSELNLIGEGSTGKMSGFYFTQGKQHLDHDTQQNHLAPHTTSDLLFKGALVGESRSVWQGMIYVAPNASKTDGYQANRNLVLDRRAHADSIPGLEILTDDVRCSHGATVGKIDAEQIFYLESRGMSKNAAERLIVEGFFDPIMQRIPFEGVKNRFQRAIVEKMKDFHQEEIQ